MKKTMLIWLALLLSLAAEPGTGFGEEGTDKKELTETARLYIEAEALHDAGKLDKAVALYREVITKLAAESDEEGKAAVLGSLATALAKQGRFEEAEEAFTTALAIFKEKHPKGHPMTGAVLNNLAGVQKLRGDLDGADRSFEESVEVFKKTLGIRHPYTIQAEDNLVLFRERRRKE